MDVQDMSTERERLKTDALCTSQHHNGDSVQKAIRLHRRQLNRKEKEERHQERPEREMMAMARALLVTVPCSPAPFSEPARQISDQCAERNVGGGGGGARLVTRSAIRVASEQGSSSAVSPSFCKYQLPNSVHRSAWKNRRLGWRNSSHFLGLDGYRICSRSKVHVLKKLSPDAVRIVAENFDPKNIDPNNVITTLVKLGKQGLEAGTKFIPDSVPRPVAQLGVGLAGLFLGSFVIRSLFSTAFFILAIGGLGYIAFLFLTKGEGRSSSGSNFDKDSGKPKSTDEALEEARRIMDKYK